MSQTSLAPDSLFYLIDDDVTFRQVLARSLTRQGFRTQAFADTASLFSEAQTGKHPDVILLDLRMEEENGLEKIPHLVKAFPDAKIIMLTGYASISTAIEAVKRGAFHYLPKPVNLDDIFTCLQDQSLTEPTSEPPEARMSPKRMDWEYIQRVLHEQNGNISATARVLGMHRRTLQRKLEKRPPK
jgi:two-component system response regulator RegA